MSRVMKICDKIINHVKSDVFYRMFRVFKIPKGKASVSFHFENKFLTLIGLIFCFRQ